MIITNYTQHLLHPITKNNATATCKLGGTEVQSILLGEGHLMNETFAWGPYSEIQLQMNSQDRTV